MKLCDELVLVDIGFHQVVDLLIEGIVLLALSLKFVDGSIFGA